MSVKKTKIISIANQKGGVAKTTTAVNLSTALAVAGMNVLLIDLDPQGNASTGLGLELHKRHSTIYDVFTNNVNINDSIFSTQVNKLDMIPSNIDLSAAEIELLDIHNKEYILSQSLEKLVKSYDYILIDCPPSLGQLTINALTCSNAILVPMQCEFYALEGLSYLLKSIDLVQKQLNPELKILGILLSMYDKRNKITEEVEKDVRNYLENIVFDTVIPRNVRITEAPSFGMPVILYDPKCQGSKAYHDAAKEVILRSNEIF